MTPDQFQAAAARTRQKPHTVAAARRVLVDGLGKSEAAVEAGMQRQAVHRSVIQVENEHRKIIGAPYNWTCVTVVLPMNGDEWDQVIEIEKACHRKAGLRSD